VSENDISALLDIDLVLLKNVTAFSKTDLISLYGSLGPPLFNILHSKTTGSNFGIGVAGLAQPQWTFKSLVMAAVPDLKSHSDTEISKVAVLTCLREVGQSLETWDSFEEDMRQFYQSSP
jgi:hypothetical protein